MVPTVLDDATTLELARSVEVTVDALPGDVGVEAPEVGVDDVERVVVVFPAAACVGELGDGRRGACLRAFFVLLDECALVVGLLVLVEVSDCSRIVEDVASTGLVGCGWLGVCAPFVWWLELLPVCAVRAPEPGGAALAGGWFPRLVPWSLAADAPRTAVVGAPPRVVWPLGRRCGGAPCSD